VTISDGLSEGVGAVFACDPDALETVEGSLLRDGVSVDLSACGVFAGVLVLTLRIGVNVGGNRSLTAERMVPLRLRLDGVSGLEPTPADDPSARACAAACAPRWYEMV